MSIGFEDRMALGTPNARRANRIPWSRPIEVLAPVQLSGRTVNVSAVGILVAVEQGANLPVGAQTSLLVPSANGLENLYLKGRVVRVERFPDRLNVAVDFLVN
ncbi:MAG: PilZ domain-containing protein [Bacteroidales bacterium]